MGCESSHFVFVFLINPKIRQTTVIFSFLPTKVNNCRHFVFFIIKGITPFCILIKSQKSSKRRPFCFFTSPKSRLTAAILFLYEPKEQTDSRHFDSLRAQRAGWQPPFCFFAGSKSRLTATILFLHLPKEQTDSHHFVSLRAQRADWQPPFCLAHTTPLTSWCGCTGGWQAEEGRLPGPCTCTQWPGLTAQGVPGQLWKWWVFALTNFGHGVAKWLGHYTLLRWQQSQVRIPHHTHSLREVHISGTTFDNGQMFRRISIKVIS